MQLKTVLLDRDGTIVVDPVYGAPMEWSLISGALEGLSALQKRGITFYFVTNQSGIGRGKITEEEFLKSQEALMSILASKGVRVAGYRYCPHLPEEACACRKPGTGMWDSLKEEFPALDPNTTLMIGDKDVDIEFGKSIGAKTARLLSGYPHETKADYTAASIVELVSQLPS